MKTLIASLALAAMAIVPAAASAQTTVTTTSAGSYEYEYVNTSGMLATMMAPDATTALNNALNLALHSGVIYIANSTQMIPTTNTVSL